MSHTRRPGFYFHGLRLRKASYRLSRGFHFCSLSLSGLVLLAPAWLIFLQRSGGREWTSLVDRFRPLLEVWADYYVLIRIYIIANVAYFLYHSWKAIQGSGARTTPAKAVGFCFIPVFNFYWVFQTTWGLARDLNDAICKRGWSEVPLVPEGIALSIACLSLLLLLRTLHSLLPFLVVSSSLFLLGLIFVWRTATSINGFVERRYPESSN